MKTIIDLFAADLIGHSLFYFMMFGDIETFSKYYAIVGILAS